MHYFHRTFIYPCQLQVRAGSSTPMRMMLFGAFGQTFGLFISNGRRLPRQQFAALRTFRLGCIEWSVSLAYTQNFIEASIFLSGKLEVYEKARNALKVNHPHFANCESLINMNVGKVEGVDCASFVPAGCGFDIRTAFYRVEDAKQVAQETEDFANEAATVAYLDARVSVLYDNTRCLVFGPVSKSIHRYNEAVNIEPLERITTTIAFYIAMW